jgi:acyl dehydratase
MKLYLDDLKAGDRFSSASRRMEMAEIKAFATEFDPQPFHLDEAAAKASLFGGLVASGWHTAAVAMRLMVDGGLPIAGGFIGTGADMRWRSPVRAGDELHVECEILEVTASRSKSDRGTVRIASRTLNQRGEAVWTGEMQVIVFRRPA